MKVLLKIWTLVGGSINFHNGIISKKLSRNTNFSDNNIQNVYNNHHLFQCNVLMYLHSRIVQGLKTNLYRGQQDYLVENYQPSLSKK
jgi:hypothetical protein